MTTDFTIPPIPKRLTKEQKIEWFQRTVINKQLEKFGLDWDQFKPIQTANIHWADQYTITSDEFNGLNVFATTLLRQLFKFTKTQARKEWAYLSLNNTLCVKD